MVSKLLTTGKWRALVEVTQIGIYYHSNNTAHWYKLGSYTEGITVVVDYTTDTLPLHFEEYNCTYSRLDNRGVG